MNIPVFTKDYVLVSDTENDLLKLEKELNIQLPSYFRLFTEHFDFSEDENRKIQFLFPNTGNLFYLGYWEFKLREDYEVMVDYIFDIRLLKSDWFSYGHDSVEFEEWKILRVGYTVRSGGFFVGLHEPTKDLIFESHWDFDDVTLLV